MFKDSMIQELRKIRAGIELNENEFNDEQAEEAIEKVDAVIHYLENM